MLKLSVICCFQSILVHTGHVKILFILSFRIVMRCCWWNPSTGCCKTSGTGLSNTYFTSTSLSIPCISSFSLQLPTTDLWIRKKRYVTPVTHQGNHTVHVIPDQPPISMCAPKVSFLPFLKLGGRFWPCLLSRQALPLAAAHSEA